MLAECADQFAFLEAKADREAGYGLDVDILGCTDVERIALWLGPQIVGAQRFPINCF